MSQPVEARIAAYPRAVAVRLGMNRSTLFPMRKLGIIWPRP
jgi:hypothetical protein